MTDVKRRPGLRSDDTLKNEDKEENFPEQCEICKNLFSQGSKLSDKEVQKWQRLNKSNIYPDLAKLKTFLCQKCAPGMAPGLGTLDTAESVSGKYTLKIFSYVFCLILFCWVSSIFVTWLSQDKPLNIKPYKLSDLENILDKNLFKLEQKYVHQDEIVWAKISSEIRSVQKYNPNRPAVLMFIYDNNSAGNTAKCLAKDSGVLASTFLKVGDGKEPVVVTGSELNLAHFLEDPGRLLVDYNQTIRDKGAMVVLDLQDVPPSVATSFHFFCDSYSPFVPTATYIFTLKVSSIEKFEKPTLMARNRLIELWSEKLPDDTYEPLITRLTPSVVQITSDVSNC